MSKGVLYHESLDNLTPADVYFGRSQVIPIQREGIKQKSIEGQGLQHHNVPLKITNRMSRTPIGSARQLFQSIW